nr:MAG TPA: hypothetical protein [Caudoviricetes sp.]
MDCVPHGKSRFVRVATVDHADDGAPADRHVIEHAPRPRRGPPPHVRITPRDARRDADGHAIHVLLRALQRDLTPGVRPARNTRVHVLGIGGDIDEAAARLRRPRQRPLQAAVRAHPPGQDRGRGSVRRRVRRAGRRTAGHDEQDDKGNEDEKPNEGACNTVHGRAFRWVGRWPHPRGQGHRSVRLGEVPEELLRLGQVDPGGLGEALRESPTVRTGDQGGLQALIVADALSERRLIIDVLHDSLERGEHHHAALLERHVAILCDDALLDVDSGGGDDADLILGEVGGEVAEVVADAFGRGHGVHCSVLSVYRVAFPPDDTSIHLRIGVCKGYGMTCDTPSRPPVTPHVTRDVTCDMRVTGCVTGCVTSQKPRVTPCLKSRDIARDSRLGKPRQICQEIYQRTMPNRAAPPKSAHAPDPHCHAHVTRDIGV